MATVLIVDDDKHTRALLERIFHNDERIARYDVRLLQAGDGVEGLKIFDEEKPDVVITDLLMPRMDGFRFCKELRARQGKVKVGLLVLSGVYRDASISSRLREEFGAGFYTKPYQIKDLVGALEKQLFRLSATATATGSTSPIPVEPAPDTPPPIPPVARKGRFDETPLPRLLFDLHEERATGTLDLRRGRIEKRIDLVVGHPVAVSSNQRGETLGHFLVLRGIITEKVHQQALEHAHDEETRLGEALMALGMLTSSDLVRHLTAQARYKITRALRWPDGEWAFRPNRDLIESASKGNALDPLAVVFLGLKKTASIEEGAAAAAALSGRTVALTPRGERAKDIIARIFGDAFAEALRRSPPVDALASPPFEPRVALPALEALLVTGCVAAGGPAGVTSSAMKAAAEPPALEELSGAFKLPRIYEDVFGEDHSEVGPPAAPAEDAEVIELNLGNDAVPEEIPLSDSSLIEIGPLGSGPVVTITAEAPPEAEGLRDRLLGEYLRLQGKDPYDVLELARDADAAAIESSFAAHLAEFALETYEPYDIGPDYAKLEEVHAVYRRAHELLTSPERRAAYDRETGLKRPVTDGERMGAELAFRAGERRLQTGNYTSAVEHLKLALDSSPDVADYHAALGWAMFRAGGEGARGAAAHLAQALAIDPDHGAAHEHLGQVLLAEGSAERAAEHLEKALDCQPPRLEALGPLEELRLALGEPKLLERRYRSLLRRARPGETALTLRLWRGLARVYLVLGDKDAARTAFQCAHRLAPEEPAFLDALADLAPDCSERNQLLAARWRLEPDAVRPAHALFTSELAAGRPDGAFLVAATMAARGLSEPETEAHHKRHRPRFLVRAMRPLDEETIGKIRHPDDDPEIGAVFAALEPAAQAFAPLEAADLQLGEADLVPDVDLPLDFARVREYLAHLLGVARPAVARRDDFGGEAHVGALNTPLLLVGPELLASRDRLELAFRLGRAMSYLAPGRAFVGSRPARKLKQLFVACVGLGGAPVALADEDLAAGKALSGLAANLRERAVRLATAIAQTRSSLNFSSYARSLARSADRIGLVVCGDVLVAAQVVRAQGGEAAATDLLDFAVSNAHQAVRVSVGLSIDV